MSKEGETTAFGYSDSLKHSKTILRNSSSERKATVCFTLLYLKNVLWNKAFHPSTYWSSYKYSWPSI